MKLKADQEADALYLSLGGAPAAISDEVAPGFVVDFDADGRAVGIEILHFSKRAPEAEIAQLLFEHIRVGE